MNQKEKKDMIKKVITNKYFDELVEQTFAKADKDGSGFIEKGEYVILCETIAKELNTTPPSEEEILAGLHNLDTNKDGKLSKEEFRTPVKYILKAVVENME